jgi:predicted nuclease of restriction endonuclease-like (RecB) superfamily
MPTKKHSSKPLQKPAKKAVTKTATDLLAGYEEFFNDLKRHIHAAQIKAALVVNIELIALYWEIGKRIVEKQEKAGWGNTIVERIAEDLQREFPGIKGFSRSNLFGIRQFYLSYRNSGEKVQQLVGQIPWGHNQVIIARIKDAAEREWYIRKTIEYGWSRAVLIYQIETRLYERQAVADKTTNFALTLPPPQSDLAQEMIKDEYIFDFLTLRDDAHEREVERALVDKIRDFLPARRNRARRTRY